MSLVKSESKRPRIDVQQAAEAAVGYFQKFFPNVSGFSLEEVELSEDEKYWLITLSFEIPDDGKPRNPLAKPGVMNVRDLFGLPKAKYKVFKIDARTGKVIAMKIRAVE